MKLLVTIIVLAAALGGGGTMQYLLSEALISHKEAAPPSLEVVPGKRFIRMTAFGFDKAAADLLWIRTIQSLKPTYPTRPKRPLLTPLSEAIITLDPHFHGAYLYCALFLRILRRHTEALDLMAAGEGNNPGLFPYPAEQGHICYFELGDLPVGDPFLSRKGILTYKDLALKHYERALDTEDCPDFFVHFYRAILTKKGMFKTAIGRFIDLYNGATTKSIREYWAWQIKTMLAAQIFQGTRLAVEAAQLRGGGIPPRSAGDPDAPGDRNPASPFSGEDGPVPRLLDRHV
ncbi:MAG: hypothetical protein ACYTFG_16195 [Planctomycetota bacterium]|jgi:hypothetical protein